MSILSDLGALAATILTGFVLILMGIVLFTVAVFTVDVGAAWAGVSASADWVVGTAGLIVAAGLIGSAIQEQE